MPCAVRDEPFGTQAITEPWPECDAAALQHNTRQSAARAQRSVSFTLHERLEPRGRRVPLRRHAIEVLPRDFESFRIE